MNKEEMLAVFEYLENTFNKDRQFYFKYEDRNQISAYLNYTDKRVAQFYINPILSIIRGE